MGQRRYLAIALAVGLAFAIGLGLGGGTLGCNSSKEVGVTVDIHDDVYTLSFNRLWGRLAQAAGVDPEGASLEEFQLFYDRSGIVRMFEFQVVTRDRYFLQFGWTGNAGPSSLSGSRIPDGEALPHSSWSVPLDGVFGALDSVGLELLEQQLLMADGATSLGLSLLQTRDQGGGGDVYGTQRALYLKDATFVELGPEDARREFGSTDVVVDMYAGTTTGGNATVYDAPTCLILPATGH